MKDANGYFKIKDARKALAAGGVNWSEGYFRNLICQEVVKSEKKYNSRVIPREEIERIISQKAAIPRTK